jgi:hypothetical protein
MHLSRVRLFDMFGNVRRSVASANPMDRKSAVMLAEP